ncbi:MULTISPECIES: hypothetical protein [Streptomyces]|uniref:LigA protein n=1 Tax=Streptomyces solicathayae TaxID=3081768 RepID=A0ABZ0LM19_9ACTN|nr:hypothetical protein [Streptomyces sp. HUAS YS2]WOX20547.1 hypothetical protein R2D22_03730 [Streptomyces sp. HUAS YS2]
MNAPDGGRQRLDPVSVLNAKITLVQLLGRAGVYAGDAEELIGLVEAGALAVAHREIGGGGGTGGIMGDAPAEKGELYAAGWLDGARAVADELDGIAGRTLRQAVGSDTAAEQDDDPRTRVGRMEIERAKVAVTPLHLTFAAVSDLDPEVSEQVLVAVLGTMGPRARAGYAGRLTEFASAHRVRLERLFAEYGPGSPIAIHGRYSLLHSPTCVAVLERLAVAPAALREEWDAAELPPAWLDGLTTAWDATA